MVPELQSSLLERVSAQVPEDGIRVRRMKQKILRLGKYIEKR
jgi:hypothetical protein